MKTQLLSILNIFLVFIVAGALLSSSQSGIAQSLSIQTEPTDTVCRFGITSVLGSAGYDIASLGVGSYLDWMAGSNPILPEGVEYIRVLRLRDDLYADTLANLPGWLAANPGSVWQVGNEPDTRYGGQDALPAENYADRYYELATIIRKLDPTARIGFGSVVQPTPIRLRYLDRAWNELVMKAGSVEEATALIDIWSIHAFILNEIMYSWGTGVPPGFEWDHEDAVEITNFADTYSISIFQQRIVAFRSWMANKGERDKPVWITEYGSLFPPEDPPDGPNYVNVSNEDTRDFMLKTFNFLLSGVDDLSGLTGDGNKLVQRWFWYSLNDYPYNFGGSIYDPRNGSTTVIGKALIDYQSNLAQPDLFPQSIAIVPFSYSSDHTRVNYRLEITIRNNQFEDATCAQVRIYDGDPVLGGNLIAGPIPSSAIRSDNGSGRVTVFWKDVLPLTAHTLFVQVEALGVTDTNPSNNLASFSVYTELPKSVFLPLIQH